MEEQPMYEFDHKGRISRYQSALQDEGVDFGIVLRPGNIRYLTGFWGYATRAEYFEPRRLLCLVVPQSGTPLLVVPKIERTFAEAAVKDLGLKIEHHVEFSSGNDSMDAWGLARTFVTSEGRTNGRISIEKPHLTERAYRAFEEKFEDFTIVESSEVIERHRDVKDEAEIRLHTECGKLAASMFNVELDAIKRGGYREYEIALLGWEHNVRAAAECIETETDNELYVNSPLGFNAQLLMSGVRLNRIHGTASTRMIEPGDQVSIDLCRVPFLLGYRTGFGRVICQRPLNSTEQDIYATLKKSYDVAVSMCRPGTVLSDIDVAARTILEEGGVGQYFTHRTGRTLGCESPEIPVAEGIQRKLEADMIVSIEPSVIMEGFQTRIESTFRITPNGPQLLTDVPEEMIFI
jgi:Xaa-Pro dipeptidase